MQKIQTTSALNRELQCELNTLIEEIKYLDADAQDGGGIYSVQLILLQKSFEQLVASDYFQENRNMRQDVTEFYNRLMDVLTSLRIFCDKYRHISIHLEEVSATFHDYREEPEHSSGTTKAA